MDNTIVLIAMGLVVCGVIAGMIAEARGASAAAGFFLGLLLGPLGILVAAILGDSRTVEAREEASGVRVKCPDCAELVRVEARVCRYCGCRFDVSNS